MPSLMDILNDRVNYNTNLCIYIAFFFTTSESTELQVFQNSFLFNICESISKMIFFLASAERESFVHLQVYFVQCPHGIDWTDFVKDSITFKETCNLTSDCILPSFYCHIFYHTYCFPTVDKLLIFLVCYILQTYLLFIKQYALTGFGDGLGSEGRMCKWVIIA